MFAQAGANANAEGAEIGSLAQMRTWALAAIAASAVVAGLYAVWELRGTTPAKAPESATERPATTVTPGRTSPDPSSARASQHSPTPRTVPRAPGVNDKPPPAVLGDSQDPQREENAREVYRSAVRELEHLTVEELPRAQAAFMRGTAALERIEDELGQDDELGHVRLQADIDQLRGLMMRFSG